MSRRLPTAASAPSCPKQHRVREISRMQRMRELAPSESAFVRAKIDDQFGIEDELRDARAFQSC